MAEAGTGFLEQLKSCIVWSWTYLWTVWFFIVLFLVYILRVPLKINDNLSTGKARAPRPAALAPPPPRKVSATRAGPRPAGAAGRALGDAPRPRTGRPRPPPGDAAPQPAGPGGRVDGACGGGRRPSRPRGPATLWKSRGPRLTQRAATAPRRDMLFGRRQMKRRSGAREFPRTPPRLSAREP